MAHNIFTLTVWLLLAAMTSVSNNSFANEDEQVEWLPLTCDIFGKEIDNSSQFPRNFRVAAEILAIGDAGDALLQLDGLQELPIAGSAQFTEEQLHAIALHLDRSIVVVDLREETHLIIEEESGKQVPITAYASQNVGNIGKSPLEILLQLELYKEHILSLGTISLYTTLNSEVQLDKEVALKSVSNVYSESELVANLSTLSPHGIDHILLPVTDHKNPTPEVADEIITLLKNALDNLDTTLLFHCQAGRGRTGLAMVLCDIAANARKYNLSLEEILHRQHLLGSPDFKVIKTGREENSAERYNFLSHFYQYAIAEDGLAADNSYTLWLESHPLDREQ